jgi:hypothetical protein
VIDRRRSCLLAATILLSPAVGAGAQEEPRGFWTREARDIVSLDVAGLRAHLRPVPRESTSARPVTLVLPMDDGGFARFAIVESPVIEAALQAQFPDIRTYRGQGLDDPSATVRLDLTPAGFHAMILSGSGTTMIDPATPGDTRRYRLRTRRDVAGRAPFRCLVEGGQVAAAGAAVPGALPYGDTLRTYRLALAADGEYTALVCLPDPPGVPCALAAMATGINRVTLVYERELAVRLVLIAGEPLIIYTDPATDPYTNGAPTSPR